MHTTVGNRGAMLQAWACRKAVWGRQDGRAAQPRTISGMLAIRTGSAKAGQTSGRLQNQVDGNPAVLIVGAYALLAVFIQKGNPRQRRVLWSSAFVLAAMLVFPPWKGLLLEWTDDDPGTPAIKTVVPDSADGTASSAGQESTGTSPRYYRHVPISLGYAPLWSKPARTGEMTFDPPKINWSRLLGQMAVVLAITILWVYQWRRRPLSDTAAAESTGGTVDTAATTDTPPARPEDR
jgi:hypothetical protein